MRKLAYPKERGKWYLAKKSSVADALAGIIDIIMNSHHELEDRRGGQARPVAGQASTGVGDLHRDSEYDDDFIN